MERKNRPKELIKDIVTIAVEYAKEDYPEEEGYVTSAQGSDILVTKKTKKGKLKTVLVLNIGQYL